MNGLDPTGEPCECSNNMPRRTLWSPPEQSAGASKAEQETWATPGDIRAVRNGRKAEDQAKRRTRSQREAGPDRHPDNTIKLPRWMRPGAPSMGTCSRRISTGERYGRTPPSSIASPRWQRVHRATRCISRKPWVSKCQAAAAPPRTGPPGVLRAGNRAVARQGGGRRRRPIARCRSQGVPHRHPRGRQSTPCSARCCRHEAAERLADEMDEKCYSTATPMRRRSSPRIPPF